MNWTFDITVRFIVDRKKVPRWRLNLFGLCAKVLCVPVQVTDLPASVFVAGPRTLQ